MGLNRSSGNYQTLGGTICTESVTLQFMGTVSNPVAKTVPDTLGAVAMVPPQSATSSARSKRPGEVSGEVAGFREGD